MSSSYDQLLDAYEQDIRAIAVKISGREFRLLPDLMQEGRITLWKLDLARVQGNEQGYVRAAVYNAMASWLRREQPARYSSLESLLARGWKVVLDPATDQVRLVNAVTYKRAYRSR